MRHKTIPSQYYRDLFSTGKKEEKFLKDFAKIKNAICFLLVNREKNQEMLSSHPHIEVLDLAMVFYYKRAEGYQEDATITIRESDKKRWGITTEKLHEIALANTVKLLPSAFQTIEQVIDDIAKEEHLPVSRDEESRERMYVLTNEEKYLGAGTILYPDVLRKIYQCLGVGFFVLPSSIHEIIIMPDSGSVTATNLQSLVADMNEHFLEAEEILSNSVYRYDIDKDELVMT